MIILMADIIGSSDLPAKETMKGFRQAVQAMNKQHHPHILSPLTITLGDEFQGVVKDVFAAYQIIFDLDAFLMRMKKPFRLRYVIHEGKIDTKINKDRAYEMLGPGLTEARGLLVAMKSSRDRFKVSLHDKTLEARLHLAMVAYQGIVDSWTTAQQKVVSVFWEEFSDYKKVAKRLKKDPTVAWRRKKTLLIDEVNSLKNLVLLTVNPQWQL